MNTHEQFYVTKALTKAHDALEIARSELCIAMQSLPFEHPARKECERLYLALYADTLKASGGDALFWNIRQVIEWVYAK